MPAATAAAVSLSHAALTGDIANIVKAIVDIRIIVVIAAVLFFEDFILFSPLILAHEFLLRDYRIYNTCTNKFFPNQE
jgi:hypothetical protein